MKTVIYYFSATGNSLAAAKNIAKNITGEVELVSIAKLVDSGETAISADKVGFIFPVYAWGLPRIVTDFITSISKIESNYTFAIATNGGTPAGTLTQLKKVLKAKSTKLNAGFLVRYDSGRLGMEIGLITFMRKISGKKPESFEKRITTITETINANKDYGIEKGNIAATTLGNMFTKVAVPAFAIMDKEFNTDSNCNGCGICEKVCPRGNLKMKEGVPTWNGNCEQCLACVHWCPKESIQIGDTTAGQVRYHNFEVSLKEIIG